MSTEMNAATAPSRKAGAATLPMILDNCSTDGVSISIALTRFEGCDNLNTRFVPVNMIRALEGCRKQAAAKGPRDARRYQFRQKLNAVMPAFS
jgi:hypothetical protein